MSVTIIQGSILDHDGDVIVNAANGFLRHGAGLAKVIADAAAPKGSPWRQSWWNEQFAHDLIPTGGVGVTSAGDLPYKAILHAVGPIWGGGQFQEVKLLTKAYSECLYAANVRDFTHIGFPAISAGIFGVPIELVAAAADLAFAEVQRDDPDVLDGLDISFYLFGDEHYEAFRSKQEINRKRGMRGI